MSDVNRIADDLLFDMLSTSPDVAGHLGIRDVGGRALAYDTLTDFSESGAAARRDAVARAARSLDAVDRSRLNESERTTYDVARYFVDDGMFWLFHGADGAAFPAMPYALNPLEGAHQVLATLLVQDHVFNTPADVEAYRRRLAALPAALAQVIVGARARVAKGFVPPRVFVEQSLNDLRGFLSPREHPMVRRLADGSDAAGVKAADKARMVREAEHAFATAIRPAYDALIAEMEAEAARDGAARGLWATPDGDAHYAFLLRGHTTTNLSPKEIHELGLSEVEALSQRIRARFAEIGISSGSVGEMYQALQTLPDARYGAGAAARGAIERDAAAILSDLETSCEGLFDRLPSAKCRLDPVPEALEASAITHYTPPSADGLRAGVFTINLADMGGRLKWELPVVCRHEMMPGHHLQLALAQQLSHLPAFRRAIVFNAYIEGWAKYAEALPEDVGLSDDPYVALCRMRGELYSTVNLVLDTGLNAMRWPVERAAAYFRDTTGVSQAFADMVVMRSLFHPGQLCSYKIGMRKMFELKSRLERARGPRFRIQEFHSLVLEEGALPLAILERRVDDAIARH